MLLRRLIGKSKYSGKGRVDMVKKKLGLPGQNDEMLDVLEVLIRVKCGKERNEITWLPKVVPQPLF